MEQKTFLFFVFLSMLVHSKAADLIEVLPVDNKIIRLTFDEGYIDKHEYLETRENDTTYHWPMDIEKAQQKKAYTLISQDDKTYKKGQHPVAIGRKSKGHDFSKNCINWYEEPWPDAACKNDYISYHFIYLELPEALKEGKTYTLKTGNLADNFEEWTFTYSLPGIRSVAIHTNQMGYVPMAPEKYAYISHWMGDFGPYEQDLKGRRFAIYPVSSATTFGDAVFEGKLSLQKDLQTGGPDTEKEKVSVYENFAGADVWQADFSTFNIVGEYVLVVDGMGSSFPFRIKNDVYFEPFYYTARALYFERAGIARDEKFAGDLHNPAWENRHVVYTSVRTMDLTDESGKNQKQRIFDSIKWDFDVSNIHGWYHDAGDWDGYYSHFKVPQDLMTAYELSPENFSDGELNIPEAQALNGYEGTHIPDMLDEAVWLVDYFKNNIGPTGGIFGSRVQPDISKIEGLNNVDELKAKGFTFADCKQGAIPSWEDCMTYIVFGEDPRDSYTFATIAAQYAYNLDIAQTITGENYSKIIDDYVTAATRAYQWANENANEKDMEYLGGSHNYGSLLRAKLQASAWMYKLTGENKYQEFFVQNIEPFNKENHGLGNLNYAVWAYATIDSDNPLYASLNKKVYNDLSEAAISYGELMVSNAIEKNRSMRMGGAWDQNVFNGQGTTPWILPAAVAYKVALRKDKEKAKKLLSACYLTADYFLGSNPLSFVWITGVGHKHPEMIMHHDTEHRPDGRIYLPGVPPYGPRHRCDWYAPAAPHPYAGDKCYYNNSNDADFALLDGRLYPPYENERGELLWPVHELYFDNYGSPPTNEFTVHQTIGPAAAAYGFLTAKNAKTSKNKPPKATLSFEKGKSKPGAYTITVKSTDEDGWIYQTELYSNNRLIGRANGKDLSVIWMPKENGSYQVWAIVKDNLGQEYKTELQNIRHND